MKAVGKMGEATPLLPGSMSEQSLPSFTNAIRSEKGRRPQAIAHRGYKAAFPENTMGAFKGAVEIGAHAIETDVHITRDGVVVLSHDPTLKRCFGKEEKIIDCDWEYIKTLRTLKEPQQQMPRLQDLLEYLASPGLEEIWVLLDIKLDNAMDDIFRLISETLAKVAPSPKRAWNQRIMMGCWAAKQLTPCITYLPEYPITHIGFNTLYARQFLKIPNASFNMFQKILTGPLGHKFMQDIRKAGRSLFVWTVNDEEMMKWSIRKEVDGVITDDPKKYLEVCRDYDGKKPKMKWGTLGLIVFYQTMAFPLGFFLRWRFGYFVDAGRMKHLLEETRAV